MEELMKVSAYLKALHRGTELTLEREDSAIPREIVLEDMKQYREELEIVQKAMEILKRYKDEM